MPTTFSGSEVVIRRNRFSIYTVVSRDKQFTDIIDHWAAGDIKLLADKLIVSGVSDDRFEPSRNVTRAEAAAIISRGLGLELEPTGDFTDVALDQWYNGEIGAALRFGLIEGYGATFGPARPIPRAEAAAILVRALEAVQGQPLPTPATERPQLDDFADRLSIAQWAEPYLSKALQEGLLNGYPDGTLRPGDSISRAELATLVKRTLIKLKFIATN